MFLYLSEHNNITVGILLIFYDSVNRVSQKQEFCSQRDTYGYQTTRFGEIEQAAIIINYFNGRKFRDFTIFGTIRESLFPRNICYLEIAKVYSRERNKSFRLAKVKKSKYIYNITKITKQLDKGVKKNLLEPLPRNTLFQICP